MERKFDKNVLVDTVIEGELLLAKADYYQTTDFSTVEGVTRFTSEELTNLLEQSRGSLMNIQTVKIPNDCQGVFFVQDAMTHLDELSPLAKHNLKHIVNRNDYLPNSDKLELTSQIDTSEKEVVKRDLDESTGQEVNVKIFQLAKTINRLLTGNHPQKKRNLEKLIKQTKGEKKRSLQKDLPFR
ncbi:hypothetical protein RT43_GL001001 [Enterococcus italicus DSM 15952]|nr:hypothetical protein RT43_GL001001 [Enterococcus italicus DSM 15952]